jgi:UDP-2,4-diacetamido-2,4,6-trideoxy-beta-L-altropyranose hydrolase
MITNRTAVFRVDASQQIGIGHVMRCLTLSDALRDYGVTVLFICQQLPGDMITYIREKGYAVVPWTQQDDEIIEYLQTMNQSIDWFIVDHYEIDVQWERLLRPYVRKIMVIDDLANRFHDCDILLDQNFYLNGLTRYNNLLPINCLKLLGPQYALLRKEFSLARKNLRERDGSVRRILIFFGGSDPTGETLKTLEAVAMMKCPDVAVDVIVGQSNPKAQEIEKVCRNLPNTVFYCQVNNMAQLMAQADLTIGAGGTATWERCYLGLPAVVIIVADNQQAVTEAVAAKGAVINMGYSVDVNVEKLCTVIKNTIDQPILIQQMSHRALQLVGTHLVSGADLIIKKMEEIHAET